MRYGAVLFDDDACPGSGWLYLDGETEYVDHMGAIPNDALLLSNLSGSDWDNRFVTQRFIGFSTMKSVLRFGTEIGVPCWIERKDNRERGEAVDPRVSVAEIGKAFRKIMERMGDFGFYIDQWVPKSLLQWLAAKLTSEGWREGNSDIPGAIRQREGQDGGVDYWMKRPVPWRKGWRDVVFQFVRRSWADSQMSVPLPVGKWEWAQDVSAIPAAPPRIAFGRILDVPAEWSEWWTPGSGSLDSVAKGRRLREAYCHSELHFVDMIGARADLSGAYVSDRYDTFERLFPKAHEMMGELSPYSITDGLIASWLAKIPEQSLGNKIFPPARVWLRAEDILRSQSVAMKMERIARDNGMPVAVAGFGAGKVHVRYMEDAETWKMLMREAIRMDLYPLMPLLKR